MSRYSEYLKRLNLSQSLLQFGITSMISVFSLLVLCLFVVGVKAQVKWCHTGCVTCNAGLPHCASCMKGFFLMREGAYLQCRECPPGCAVCSDPRMQRIYCAECKDGYYGDTCGLSCSKGCYLGKCNQSNGTCYQNKCKPYFDGTKCDQCSLGRFGNDCKSKCPKQCASCSTGTTCDKCRDGFWGDACQHNCSNGCLAGVCLKQSGICQDNKCRYGFVGEKCDKCISGRLGLNCSMDEAVYGNAI